MTMEIKGVGLDVGERRIGRLMRINGIRPVRTRRHKVATDSLHRLGVASNLLDGDFLATTPNQKWAGDISYIVNRNGLRWRDAPREYGPHKPLYNSWKRWGELGVFTRMMEGLSAQKAEPQTVMINATYLKAHRTASSLGVRKGIWGA